MFSSDVEVSKTSSVTTYREKPYTMTNLGLRLEDALIQAALSLEKKVICDTEVKNALFSRDFITSNRYLMPLG